MNKNGPPSSAPRHYGWGPRGLGQRVFQCLVNAAVRPFLKLEIHNPPDLGRMGPVILAPNHASFLDPPLLQLVFWHHITFMMTEVIYSRPPFSSFFRFWETIPVPENGSSAGAIKRALKAIRNRRPVCIFPEGGISDDGYLQPGQGGVVTLMARAQVPVIPTAILGTFRTFPRPARLIRPGRIVIRFGDPILPPVKPSREDVRDFADRIMDAIHKLGAPRHGEPLALERYRL